MKEIWKDIENYEGLYQVSNFGKVKSLKRKCCKELKPFKNNMGYMQVALLKNGNRLNKTIHRLVADAFCDKPIGCNVVNHLDNDITNNKSINLEWTTQSGNIRYAQMQGRMCDNNRMKATEARRKQCLCIETGEKFISAVEAATCNKLPVSSIVLACNGKIKTSGGYHWKYIQIKEV